MRLWLAIAIGLVIAAVFLAAVAGYSYGLAARQAENLLRSALTKGVSVPMSAEVETRVLVERRWNRARATARYAANLVRIHMSGPRPPIVLLDDGVRMWRPS